MSAFNISIILLCTAPDDGHQYDFATDPSTAFAGSVWKSQEDILGWGEIEKSWIANFVVTVAINGLHSRHA